jgi:hypothetical protein
VTSAVLAGAIGKEALLAVRQPDDTVRLTRIPSSRLAERLVAQTPDVPAAAGVPVVVARSELHAAGRVRGSAAVRRLLALPTIGAGELYVGRCDDPISYVDTVGGRVVVTALVPDAVRVGAADLVAQLRRSPMEYR